MMKYVSLMIIMCIENPRGMAWICNLEKGLDLVSDTELVACPAGTHTTECSPTSLRRTNMSSLLIGQFCARNFSRKF